MERGAGGNRAALRPIAGPRAKKLPFDVWRYVFKDKGGEHPAVLVSHPDICARSAIVNVLYCTSQRESRRPYPHEVMLGIENGLDWETCCNCAVMYAVPAADLLGCRGRVGLERRIEIRRKVQNLFRLAATD